MKYVSRRDRWWLVVAIAFVVFGSILIAVPRDDIAVVGDTRYSGIFIGAVGVSIVILTLVQALIARRKIRARDNRPQS